MWIDETQNVLVRLAVGQAVIESIIIHIGGRTYDVIPGGEAPLGFEGESGHVDLIIRNNGDDSIIFAQLSSVEGVTFANMFDGLPYLETFVASGGAATALDGFAFGFTMPNTNVNVKIEAGHL